MLTKKPVIYYHYIFTTCNSDMYVSIHASLARKMGSTFPPKGI